MNELETFYKNKEVVTIEEKIDSLKNFLGGIFNFYTEKGEPTKEMMLACLEMEYKERMGITLPEVKFWDRIRFRANNDDYRPVIWPPMGPYWCSGYGDDYSIIVAYIPHKTTYNQLKEYWPEANNIDVMEENVQIIFSNRFPKPNWWTKHTF